MPSEDVSPDKVLDATNLSCPIPLMKTLKTIRGMRKGEVLEVRSTDPGSKVDIPRWGEKAGYKVLKISEEEGVFKIFIEKGD